jgi:hypothetical protein
MNFVQLPDDWPAQRATLRRIATHVVAQSQQKVTGHFALMALPGGFGTPQFGPDRKRVRLSGGSLFVENAQSMRDGEHAATTDVHMIAGSTIRDLCAAAGFEPDPEFSVGDDTPPPGDIDEMLMLDSDATTVLGDWYLLGQRAVDVAIASLPDPQASIVRLWPEHFDVGIDLAVDSRSKPGIRTNLGAAAGDEFHQEPYLYVAPWGGERPGPAEFWNAPFGATLGYGDLDVSGNPLAAATEFFLHGIAYLRA